MNMPLGVFVEGGALGGGGPHISCLCFSIHGSMRTIVSSEQYSDHFETWSSI